MAALPAVSERIHKLIMQTMIEQSPVTLKTRELCQAIVDQPNMSSIRQRIDAFMGDEKTRAQYDGVMSKGQALQQKQQMSLPLTGEEISDFEQHREALLGNPVARGFMDAQEELHQVQESIQQYVTKTLELGRVPAEEEMDSGSCGHGCGCSH
jgi:cell fate (sporulation/competence/biofilm development) regulator YlbF (YheA/YmcA/DUF963 family)